MKIDLSRFLGTMPLADPYALPDGHAQVAIDCDLRGGMLAPMKGLRLVGSLGRAGVKSIHKFGYQSAEELQWWFSFQSEVDCAKAPVFNDVEERTYFTGAWPSGASTLKKTRLGMGNAGMGPYPDAWLDGSLPAPTTVATASASGGDATLEPEARTYVETFVSSWGEESEPGPPTARVTVNVGGTVQLDALSPVPSGAFAITHRRLYRLNYVGGDTSDLQLVVELPIGTTSYTDNVAKLDLGGVLATRGMDAAPQGLVGLLALPNGMMAAFKDFDVYLSEPGMPYAWPIKYAQTVESPVVGLGRFGQSVVALTSGRPFVGYGTHPDEIVMTEADVPDSHTGCLSKRGIVSTPGAVYYPTRHGIAMIGAGAADLVTSKYANSLSWPAFAPASMLGCSAGGRLIFFYDTGATKRGLVLDPEVIGLVETSIHATAQHKVNGRLYLVVNDQLYAWEEGDDALPYTWRSRRFQLPNTANFSCGRIIADSYPVTMKVYADGVLRATKTVASKNDFTLPAGFDARDYEIELTGTAKVRRVAIAESAEELQDVIA